VFDTNMHYGEPIVQPRFGTNRPPVVQKDLEWSPHRNPPTNEKALLQHRTESNVFQQGAQRIAENKGARQEYDSDEETHAPHSKELSQSATAELGAAVEVGVHGLREDQSLFRFSRRMAEMDQQR
jgi:hypothetical protein